LAEESGRQPPLAGVRVLAVEQFGAGPWGTMMLADLGAEVIKIENPMTGGDVGRSVPPYTVDQDSLYFQSFNRSKKSLTLDLQSPEGRDIFHRLVAVSDAVYNNLRGDVPGKLGLDYANLKGTKQAIVCCSLSAFGRTGERAADPGYDYLMQGYAGWMSITGDPATPPQKSGLSLVDLSAGVLASLATVSAILNARRSGLGCDVDVSLFDTAIAQLAYLGAWHLTEGYQPVRQPDSAHPSQVPSQILPTRDGHIVVMCAKEKFYQNLVKALGVPELVDDPRFRTAPDRMKHRDALVAILKPLTQTRTTAEWMGLLKGDVPCAPVNTVEEALADRQAVADGMIEALPHWQFGIVRQPASPIKIDGDRASSVRGPALGEHTDEVLDLIGVEPGEVRRLRDEGVI